MSLKLISDIATAFSGTYSHIKSEWFVLLRQSSQDISYIHVGTEFGLSLARVGL